MNIDVAIPDPPQRELTGAHRLQDLDTFVREINILMDAAGCPLTSQFQKDCLCCSLHALLFGEQQP